MGCEDEFCHKHVAPNGAPARESHLFNQSIESSSSRKVPELAVCCSACLLSHLESAAKIVSDIRVVRILELENAVVDRLTDVYGGENGSLAFDE